MARHRKPGKAPAQIIPRKSPLRAIREWAPLTRDDEVFRPRVTLAIVVLIGAALRLWYLNQPMRYDESVTYLHFVRLPWAGAVSDYSYPNNHIFHTLLVKLCVTVMGNEPWVLRLPAFMAGVLIIPASYAAASPLYGQRVGMLTAALVAGSGPLILFSTNARGYSLVILATLLVVWLAARAREHSSPLLWGSYVLVGVLGLWTIPIMLYPLGGTTLWFLWTSWREASANSVQETRRSVIMAISATLGAGILATVLYWPVIQRSGFAILTGNKFVGPMSWDRFFLAVPPGINETVDLFVLGGGWPLVIVLVPCLLAGMIWHQVRARRAVPLLIPMTLWCSALLLITHHWPFARVWLFLLPLWFMLAAVGIDVILAWDTRRGTDASRWISLTSLATVLLMCGMIAASDAVARSRDTGTLFDAEAMVRTLRTQLQTGDRVVALIPAHGPLSYWMDKLGIDTVYLTSDPRKALRHFVVVDIAEGEMARGQIDYLGLADTTIFSVPKRLEAFRDGEIVLVENKRLRR